MTLNEFCLLNCKHENNNGNACSDFSGKRTIGSLKNPLINNRSNTKPLRNKIKLS